MPSTSRPVLCDAVSSMGSVGSLVGNVEKGQILRLAVSDYLGGSNYLNSYGLIRRWIFKTICLRIRTIKITEIFHWICLLFILLILVGVKLPMCMVVIVVTLYYNAVICFLEPS